ncbi:uncharacterized protein LOC18102059 isoform X2 [Populus trichocarpa]|uniref:uncharacterized protein LOC18102059 isoform X2 n=1 Tax=Populus trichocarpa TaxID=3694 RepID=UPI000D18B35D|nr:uncharacterized protein LOC18102059 isoform X2 [Populus trichocarpa]|eukprot:XP_024464875.1 uncharacterized protein LOC18102059 isoform X2 [Populus trichocarpa]
MTSVINIDGHEPLTPALQHQGEMESKVESSEKACGNHGGICAICLDKIVLQETALVKGCEHAYCIQDYMFEESVCLLLRAAWFMPLTVEDHEDFYEDPDDYYPYEYEYEYEDEDDDLDGVYLSSSSNLRIGNRRWGDNGYVRAGRQEARPVHRSNFDDSGAGSSREPKKKEAAKDRTGRRAKRTLKREAADKAAAAKHQQHLTRLGRK